MKELTQLYEHGFTRLGTVVDPEQANRLINESERLLTKRAKAGNFVGSPSNVLLYSPFFEYKSFMDILLIKKIHEILSIAIDEDFTLMHYACGNRSLSALSGTSTGNADQLRTNVAADKWHVDSRYNNNRRLGDGFSYILIIALDEFCSENATQVVSKSHLDRNRPLPDGDYDPEIITLAPGEAVLLDSGTWHRGGNPISRSRWGLHLFFAPWFVKPYYDYVKRGLPDFTKDYSASDRELIKKLLHYYSTPPRSETERIKTVIPYRYSHD